MNDRTMQVIFGVKDRPLVRCEVCNECRCARSDCFRKGMRRRISSEARDNASRVLDDVRKDGDRVRLVSRQDKEDTKRFAGLVEAVRKLRARKLVLDGEVGRYDQQLVSRFEWLRSATPPMFMAFDLLQLAFSPSVTDASGSRTYWMARP